MPVISLCSTKGGVGKSTTALVLAQVLSTSVNVTLIDADPNQPLATWAARFSDRVPRAITVVAKVTEETIVDEIDAASARHPFVIVDLEGTANVTASYAIGRSDLVLIPMRGKQLDADQAGRVVSLIEREAKAFRRTIPYRVLFTMTSPALLSREEKHIKAALEAKGIPILRTSITERAAFSAIFQVGGTIFDLTREDVSNPFGAMENAKAFASEVITTLKGEEVA